MKIRYGFVSNSSSSSYILALPKEKECEHCGHTNGQIIELVSKLFSKGTWDDYVPVNYGGDFEGYIGAIENEIEEIDKDIAWTLKKTKVLENLSKNEDAITLFSEWNEIKQQAKPRWRRKADESNEEYGTTPREKLKEDVGWLGDQIEINRRKKTSLEAKKRKIEEAIKSDDTLYAFEIDHQDSARDTIEMLIKNGIVKVIEKIVT